MGSLFLDTSIEIARRFRGEEMRARIEATLREHEPKRIGSVVRQEFKRRVLKEAAYLLRTLNKLGDVAKLRRHVLHVLPPQLSRKREICLSVLETFFEAESSSDHAERLRRYLRSLLVAGIDDLEGGVDELRESGCALSTAPIIEKRPYAKYDFGKRSKCQHYGTSCGITEFVSDKSRELEEIREGIRGADVEKLQEWVRFIDEALENPCECPISNPCERFGDVLIALESSDSGSFYTVNYKDSRHLCPALGQALLVRPNDPTKEDERVPPP